MKAALYNPGGVNLAALMRLAEIRADDELPWLWPEPCMASEDWRTRKVRREFRERAYPSSLSPKEQV